jgi:uncharacterized delta-60 repeat protein
MRAAVATALLVLIAGVAAASPGAHAGPSGPLPLRFIAADQQPDGKIIVAGVGRSDGDLVNVVSRFAADGQSDSQFGGGDGRVVIEHSAIPSIRGVAVAPGDSILLGVNPSPLTPTTVLYRLDPDGGLDQSFGNGGAASAPDFEVHHVSVAPDGRPMVAGAALQPTDEGDRWFMAVARFTADGHLDPTFGGDGIALVPPGASGSGSSGAQAVIFQPDGKVLAAGSLVAEAGGRSLALARLLPNGSLDPTFGGGDGVVAIKASDGRSATGSDVALQPDGRILVGGSALSCCTRVGTLVPTPMLVRLTAEGVLDQSFGDGGDGERLGGCPGGLELLRFRDDGIIGASGTCQLLYPNDGTGVNTIRAGRAPDPGPGFLQISPLLIQASGSVLLGGSHYAEFGTEDAAALVRFAREGHLDPAFGAGGMVLVPELRRCRGRLITEASAGEGLGVLGTTGDDVILGSSEADSIYAFTGDDLICAGEGADRIGGGGGRDRIFAAEGGDRVQAGLGTDVAFGGGGADEVFGNGDGDRLFGGVGGDRLVGGDGNDILRGGRGRDRLLGGAGKDVERP